MKLRVTLKRFAKRPPLQLLLVLPVLFYLAVAVLWQATGLYSVTGDEPIYLLTTDSLASDGDFVVRDNLFADSSLQKEILERQGRELSETGYANFITPAGFSAQGPGMAFVLLIPYYVGGVAGAKIFLALLAGLFPLLMYRAARQITESETWSVVVALSLGIGLPFLAASNQVYPDLVGGLIVLFVAERLVKLLMREHEQRFTVLASLGIGALISFLPWLHVRLFAPAIVLLLGYIYAVLTARSDQALRLRWRYWAIPAATFALSVALLTYYNYVAAHPLLGLLGGEGVPGGEEALGGEGALEGEGELVGGTQGVSLELIKKAGMIFLGLHWDQLEGMFMQQPLLLLGLVGVVPLVKANRRVALLLGALYLSVLVVVSLHLALPYGGGSFVGRFGWAAVSLWIFPLSYAVRLLLEHNMARLVALLCVFSFILQGLFAAQWLLQNGFLLRKGLVLTWARASLYDVPFDPSLLARLPLLAGFEPYLQQLGPKFWTRLPLFTGFDTYLVHPSNWVIMAVGLLLVASGWLWQRGTVRLANIAWGLFLPIAIGAIMFFPPALEPVSFPAGYLPGLTGTLVGESRVAAEAENEEGDLIQAPLRGAQLPVGMYKLTLEYESSPASEDTPAPRWEIFSRPDDPIREGELPPSVQNGGEFEAEFPVKRVRRLGRPLKFSVEYPGQGYLRVERLTITPLNL